MASEGRKYGVRLLVVVMRVPGLSNSRKDGPSSCQSTRETPWSERNEAVRFVAELDFMCHGTEHPVGLETATDLPRVFVKTLAGGVVQAIRLCPTSFFSGEKTFSLKVAVQRLVTDNCSKIARLSVCLSGCVCARTVSSHQIVRLDSFDHQSTRIDEARKLFQSIDH